MSDEEKFVPFNYKKGHVRTFGFLRSPEWDRDGDECWEAPDGTLYLLRKGQTTFYKAIFPKKPV